MINSVNRTYWGITQKDTLEETDKRPKKRGFAAITLKKFRDTLAAHRVMDRKEVQKFKDCALKILEGYEKKMGTVGKVIDFIMSFFFTTEYEEIRKYCRHIKDYFSIDMDCSQKVLEFVRTADLRSVLQVSKYWRKVSIRVILIRGAPPGLFGIAGTKKVIEFINTHGLKKVNFRFCHGLTDEQLKLLPPNITSLIFPFSSYPLPTIHALETIGKMENLKCLLLKLEVEKIDNEDFGSLFDKLKKLTALKLMCFTITDAGFRAISRSKQLEHLSLDSCKFTDKHLASLFVKNLISLEFRTSVGSRLSALYDVNFQVPLLQLGQLERLSLNYCELTDTKFKCLFSQLKNLKSLEIVDPEITSGCIRTISQLLKQLEHLTLDGPFYNDNVLKPLPQLKNLKSLRFRECGITTAGLKKLDFDLDHLTVTIESSPYACRPCQYDPHFGSFRYDNH